MSRVADEIRKIVTELDKQDQDTLLAFAEFLMQRLPAKEKAVVNRSKKHTDITKPKMIKRPKDESVIQAIKRLSSSYPMLDKSKMLQDTYPLMLEHNLEGRPAKDVIDDLETVFLKYYDGVEKSE